MLADRVQLQQVMLNLIMNGIDAMASVKDRTRRLTIKSELQQSRDVLITVHRAPEPESSPDDMDRSSRRSSPRSRTGWAWAFLSADRSSSARRSLWASAGTPHGSVFHIVLQARQPRWPMKSQPELQSLVFVCRRRHITARSDATAVRSVGLQVEVFCFGR